MKIEIELKNPLLPAEWEKHEATYIGCPHNKNDWPGKFTPILWVYGEIVKRICEGEIVRIFVNDKAHEQSALRVLRKIYVDLSNIEFINLKTDRGWLRDSSPAFVKTNESKIQAVQFRFNGWAKYPNYKYDLRIPQTISRKYQLPLIPALHENRHVILEGGAIDTNGRGTLITTEECLMDEKVQVRNPGFTKTDYEEVFKKYFGIKNILWLGKGIAGDDTHGHVDDLCRFVNPNTVVIVQENNPKDENYISLKENRERLETMTLQDGSKVQVVELPMPEPLYFDGQRLPASYANFYISNAYVIVPTFNDPMDRIALGILAELFLDRKVVGIHSVDLVWGLGTIHCLTHEHPAE